MLRNAVGDLMAQRPQLRSSYPGYRSSADLV